MRRDEWAAVREGRPLDDAWLGKRIGEVFFHSPSFYRDERAYGFDEGSDRMERNLRARLTKARGWDQSMTIRYRPPKDLQDRMATTDGWAFNQKDNGDEIAIFRFRKPEDGVRLVVVVREARFSWPRLWRRAKGAVGL